MPLPCAAVNRPLTLLVLAALTLAGCSIGSDSSSSSDDTDDRNAALTCLTDKGLDAGLQGDDAITVGDPRRGPRIVFFLTSGEAEAAQFEGNGEGSEQIGSALLYTRHGTDDELKEVETCLSDL
jgi:hypothetical protein